MLIGIIVVSLAYVAVFLLLWGRTQFALRRPPARPVRAIPWRSHLFIDAPSEAEAAEAFLRMDLDLAERGQ